MAGTAAFAADHREAPRISEFPPADIGDIYAFRAPAAPNRLVLVMTVNGISDPEFAGSYLFSPRVRYTFTIDTDADAIPNRRIDVTFTEPQGGAQEFRARFPQGITVDGSTTPPTVSPAGPAEPVIVEGPGILAFAGPRDDPFFFDAVGFNRFRAGSGTFSGDDSFGEHNVSAIVLEFPIRLVDDGDGLLEIGGLTTRRMAGQYPADDRRLDRTGVPAVSTAFIPTDQRDDFNRGLFKDDAADFADEIVASLQAPPYETPQENIDILASVAIPDTLKLDLEQPIGFPNGRALEDDVIDTLLGLILDGPIGDGVDSNDRAFLDTFPYLAPPFQAP
ncbi:MAG TPA: DUF4331 family protein [Geminicoccaceae bacterium]